MKVLGIDPGYAIIGFSILEVEDSNNDKIEVTKNISLNKYQYQDIKLISYGIINTDPDKTYIERLKEISENFLSLIKRYKPDILAIEKLFYFKNKKTIMHVSEVRGALILLAIQNGIEVYEYTPLQIKLAITSYGRATKQQIQMMIKKIFNLDEVPYPDDAADAIACALTCLWSEK
jgi:crossover junction endodeoxyribonuclease RuvC